MCEVGLSLKPFLLGLRSPIFGWGHLLCREVATQTSLDTKQQGAAETTYDLNSDHREQDVNSSASDAYSRLVSEPSLSETDGEDPQVGFSLDAVMNALKDAVSKHGEPVTIAYPRFEGAMTFELISNEFEELSAYGCNELLGKSLRCLTYAGSDRIGDYMSRNRSEMTGEASVTNTTLQRKTGELVSCRVFQRGLTVAFDPETGEKLWVLLAIYRDVTDLPEDLLDSYFDGAADRLRILISNTMDTVQNLRNRVTVRAEPSPWHLLTSCPWQPSAQHCGRANTGPPHCLHLAPQTSGCLLVYS